MSDMPPGTQKKLSEILTGRGLIGYEILSDETDYSSGPMPKQALAQAMLLPCDKDSDPFYWADLCTKKYAQEGACVLVPGTAFDAWGTRRGRGLGWYDRFLSRLPAQWPRIGIADSSKLSSLPLVQKAWDQPVDWILVYEKPTSSWTAYETGARSA